MDRMQINRSLSRPALKRLSWQIVEDWIVQILFCCGTKYQPQTSYQIRLRMMVMPSRIGSMTVSRSGCCRTNVLKLQYTREREQCVSGWEPRSAALRSCAGQSPIATKRLFMHRHEGNEMTYSSIPAVASFLLLLLVRFDCAKSPSSSPPAPVEGLKAFGVTQGYP